MADKAPPIYAVRPINVHGTLYPAGKEIHCGSGSRRSLLNFGQATLERPLDEPPAKPRAKRAPADATNETTLDALSLSTPAHRALDKLGVRSIEQLAAAIAAAGSVDQLAGIGDKLSAELTEALRLYEHLLEQRSAPKVPA